MGSVGLAKSTPGGSKIEVWRVQNRGLEGFWTASGAAGRNLNLPEGIWDRLGNVFGSSWGCLGVRLGGPGAVCRASWEPGGRLWGILRIAWRHLKPS